MTALRWSSRTHAYSSGRDRMVSASARDHSRNSAFHKPRQRLWVLGGLILLWFMEAWARYCRKRGEGYATDGKIEGAALWIPPGRYPLSNVGMMLAGMILLPFKFGRAAFSRMMTSLNCHERLHKRDVPQRYWYLSPWASSPHGRARASAAR